MPPEAIAGRAAGTPAHGGLPRDRAGEPRHGTVPASVIDTNVWLDLYLFGDASAQALGRALATGALTAIRNASTDAELRRVIARPVFATRLQALATRPLADWEALAGLIEAQRPAPWLCRDPDDQKFLDLAYGAGAQLLFTKDRAVLSLARRARRDGLLILEPKNCPVAADVPTDIGYR